jgi:hypothetical protein
MKRTPVLIPLFLTILILAGCSNQVTTEFLLEGKWLATAGYEDGEIIGEPNCSYIEGLTFKDENTVYLHSFESDYEYSLDDSFDNAELIMRDGIDALIFETIFIDEDSFAIVGKGLDDEQHCYLERQIDE